MSYFGIPIRNGLPIGLGSVAPLASGGGSPFSPLSLFSGGAPGAWYDPSDYGATGTLFQDSAGTTPVTAVEQPVGLMLDKSQGLVLGSELVTNGGPFTTTTGWSTTSAVPLVASGGTLNASCVGATDGLIFGAWNTPNSSRNYLQMSVTITAITGRVRFKIYGINAVGDWITSPGTYQVRLYQTDSNSNIGLNTDQTSSISISSFSAKQLPGNHAFQATSASRPVLSARYNLLTKTEDFSAAAWVKTTGVTGYSTGRITYDGTGVSGWRAYQSYAAITSGLISVVVSGTGTFLLYTNNGDSVSITATSTPTRHTLPVVLGAAGGNLGIFQSGNTAIDVVINFDLRVSNNGITQPTYQRVNTATDYATTGFLPYLKFDGVDDSLSTNSISFTSTDKMSVFAGVRKLSDAAAAILAELSAVASTNNGAFYVATPDSPATYGFGLRGTNSINRNASTYTAPITNVLAASFDIAQATPATELSIRINAATPETIVNGGASDAGTGNFGNYPLYIGRRGGTSLLFNGQLYGLIIVGKAVTAGELSSTETYVNQKTGAY